MGGNFTEEDIKYLKMIFVTREECTETTENLKDRIDKEYTDLEVIKMQTKWILGILSAVGLAVLALVVRQFWGVGV